MSMHPFRIGAFRRPGASCQGFTLLEMLVASMVFVVGFISVFALFLAGTRFRAQGDLETRSAIALRNLVEEIQLDAGTEESAPVAPSQYVGSGFVKAKSQALSNLNAQEGEFNPCPGMPGMFYRVMAATDCAGRNDAQTSVVYLRIIIISFPTDGDQPLTLKNLARRLAIREIGGDELVKELVRRGVATDNHVAIMRQPSWLRETRSN